MSDLYSSLTTFNYVKLRYISVLFIGEWRKTSTPVQLAMAAALGEDQFSATLLYALEQLGMPNISLNRRVLYVQPLVERIRSSLSCLTTKLAYLVERLDSTLGTTLRNVTNATYMTVQVMRALAKGL